MSRSVGAKDKQKRAAGGGRKPKAFTLLKKRVESEKVDDADFAFAMYVSVMRDNDQDMPLRLDCADWVYKQVAGLPKARTEMSGNEAAPIILKIVYGDGTNHPPARP